MYLVHYELSPSSLLYKSTVMHLKSQIMYNNLLNLDLFESYLKCKLCNVIRVFLVITIIVFIDYNMAAGKWSVEETHWNELVY